MLTICTVCLSPMEGYLDTMFESVCNRLDCVTEICVAYIYKNEAKPSVERFLTRHDGTKIVVRELTLAKQNMYHNNSYRPYYGHAEGLHMCLENATQDYVMFVDPDVFFYKGADKFYIDTYCKYDLNIIGVCHHHSQILATGWFPYIINSLMKRSTLPDKDWLKGHLKFGRGIFQYWLGYSAIDEAGEYVYDLDGKRILEETLTECPGKFLVQGAIPEQYHIFPFYNKGPKEHPPYIFDAGCNLYLWNEERNGKWISFPTLDTHTYATGVSRNNFKLKDRFKNQKLLYHVFNGYHCCTMRNDGFDILRKAYEDSKA